MPYRRLGRSGLQVSVLSFGSAVSFGGQLGQERTRNAWRPRAEGVNFFDNAEVTGRESERIMGKAIAELGWARGNVRHLHQILLGAGRGPNLENTLNRKYLHHAVDGSLERLGLDFVDLVFCHRTDPQTPIEETV